MTAHPLLLEQHYGRWIAHVADLPGCFGDGAEPDLAVAAVPAAIEEYVRWRKECEGSFAVKDTSVEVAEQFPARRVGDHSIHAFFEADREPLVSNETKQYRQFLQWSRQSLLRSTLGLYDSHMRLPLRGERWPILGVLNHVADSEIWYLDRLGYSIEKSELPEDAFKRLNTVRDNLQEVLPQLAGDDHVVERDGELWYARKLLQRALWHERDHTFHIRKMRAQLDN